jgi:hypothetical protein
LDRCFLDSNDQIFVQYSFPNDLNGASNIKELILEYYLIVPYESTLVGMESTSVCSFQLTAFRHEDPDLKALGEAPT